MYAYILFLLCLVYMKQKGKSYEAILIGHQIRYVRRVKDMSQSTLAEKVGMSLGWIGRVERGLYLPNLKLLFKIAKALQVKVKDLLPAEL